MPGFVVSTAFKGKDGISSAFKNMSKNADKFGTRANKAFSRASKSASRFKDIVKGVLTANVLTRGTMMLSQGMRTVTDEFINFDQSITSAAAKFPGKIKRGTEEFKKLGLAARGVGATTQFTAAEAADSLDFMAMAGLNADQAMAALPGVADLATATNIELARSADVATDALGAFGLMTKDPTKLTQNLTRVNDVFAKTLTSANLDMEQFVGTMEQSASVAKVAGVDLETYGALVKPMADSFIKGSKAGTTLKNMFLRLSSPPREAAKALEDLGIKTRDSDHNLRDMIDIVEDIRLKTKGMGTAQRAAAMDAIFSKRAVAGASVIVDAGAEKLNEYRKNLEGATGASAEMAGEMRKSLINKLLTLKSGLIEVGIKVIDAFQDKFPEALDKAIEAIQGFDATPLIEGIETAVDFIKDLFKFVKDITPLIAGLTVAVIVYKVAMVGLVAVKAVQFFFQTAAAIRAASVSMGLLNAVFIASPIGLIAVAVGLLVAGAVWLYKNWDKVKAAFQRFYEYISPKIRMVINVIDELLENPFFVAAAALIAPWLLGAAMVIKHWDKVKILFRVLGGVYDEAILIVADGIEWLVKLFTKVKNAVVGFATKAIEKFSELLENPFFAFASTMLAPWLTAPALIIKHWEKVVAFFKGLWGIVGKVFSAVGGTGDKVGGLVGDEGNAFFEDLSELDRQYKSATGPQGRIEAPNKTEVEVTQKDRWYGQLDISGAPKGSVFEQNTTKAAPKINVEMLGANP
jgi:TP901 family phage tail tape measure protein